MTEVVVASLEAVDGLEAVGLRGVVAFGAEDAADPSRWPPCWPSTTPWPSAARPAA